MKIGRKYGEKEKIKILIKSLIFRTLRIYIFSFYAFLFFVSFADAKMLKDILKHHIIRHFPCNIRNEENTLPYILRKKISRYMRFKPILYPVNSI